MKPRTISTLAALLLAVIAGQVGIAPIYVESVERHLVRAPLSVPLVGLAYFGPSFVLAAIGASTVSTRMARRSRVAAGFAAMGLCVLLFPLVQAVFIATVRAVTGFAMHDALTHVVLAAPAGIVAGLVTVASIGPRR